MNSLKQAINKRFVLNQPKGQAHRTLDLLVLNLMPNKLETESQLLNLCSGLTENLTFTFMYPATHHFKSNTLPYLQETYATFDEIKEQNFDGLIVTGAPVETLPFKQVDYWEEFEQLLDWSQTHVKQSLFICWAAQAALHHDFGIEKYPVRPKIFGIFEHHIRRNADLLEGLPEQFYLPHSRHTTLSEDDILATPGLNLLVSNDNVGPAIMQSQDHRRTYITGHPEYSTNTLANEYQRDLRAGKPITIPENYFYANDPSQQVINRWHETSKIILQNWLNNVD